MKRPSNIDSIKEYCKQSSYNTLSAAVVLELIKYIEHLEKTTNWLENGTKFK
jgi:hypothetical protein